MSEATGEIDRVLNALSLVASDSGAKAESALLLDVCSNWSAPHVRVGVFGEVSQGKSSVTNALIDSSFLATGGGPVTASWTEIRHGSEPAVHAAIVGSGSTVRWVTVPMGQFGRVQAGEIRDLDGVAPSKGDRLAGLSLEWPSTFLAQGFRLYDTPGVGGLRASHRRIALEALKKVDAFIFVVRPDTPLSVDERLFLGEGLLRCGACFLVQTHADLIDESPAHLEETLASLRDVSSWEKIEKLSSSALEIATLCQSSLQGACVAVPDGGTGTSPNSGIGDLQSLLDSDVLQRRVSIQRQNVIQLATRVAETVGADLHRRQSVMTSKEAAEKQRAANEERIRQWEEEDGDRWRPLLVVDLDERAEALRSKGVAEVEIIRREQQMQLSGMGRDQIEAEMKLLSSDVPATLLGLLVGVGADDARAAVSDVVSIVAESDLAGAFARLETLDVGAKIATLDAVSFSGVGGAASSGADKAYAAAKGSMFGGALWGSLKRWASSGGGKGLVDRSRTTPLGGAVATGVAAVAAAGFLLPAVVIAGGAMVVVAYESDRQERIRNRSSAERHIDLVCRWMTSYVVALAVQEFKDAARLIIEDVEAILEDEVEEVRKARDEMALLLTMSAKQIEGELARVEANLVGLHAVSAELALLCGRSGGIDADE